MPATLPPYTVALPHSDIREGRLAVSAVAAIVLLAVWLLFITELRAERVRACGLLLWSAPPGSTRGGAIRHVDPEVSVSSKAVVVGPACLAHTAQLLPLDRRGRLVGANRPDEQAEQILDNLEAVLAEVRSGLDALVKLNVYVANDKAA